MYNHQEIEKKWQAYWEENKTFKTDNNSDKPKFYALDMFPYPSGAGLHVGHPEGYTANDIVSRYKKASGYNVLHPMGWDAFGLPAENYAIKTGTNPKTTTKKNIETFKSQIKRLGFSYDWDREIDTTNPKYYKWTQWIFSRMFEHGLAYEQDLPINYCPKCMVGVANEEVLNNGTHERCGTGVEKKKLRQWVLGITKYADRLESDVDELDWPEGIKDMQKKWIGKSEGCEFEMKLKTPPSVPPLEGEGVEGKTIKVYTTRIDTVFGMTYAVIAPDHENVGDFITAEQKDVCEKYIDNAKNKSDLDRTGTKEKTGVFTGSYVINPFNGEDVPLWIGDYVLGNYGTGAVMAVPAHDERDFEFAKKYDLMIIPSVLSKDYTNVYNEFLKNGDHKKLLAYEEENFKDYKAYTKDGFVIGNKQKDIKNIPEYFGIKNNLDINPEDVDFIESNKAREIFTDYAQQKGFGTKKTNYKLRDWLFSRQRYWGEPIPLIHLDIEDIKKLPHIEDIKDASDLNKAYILKRSPREGEKIDNCNCGGKVRELVIGGKVFSKIYDGLYSKIIIDPNLPLELPEVENYEPSPDGNSPLARIDDFVNIKLADNLSGKRETNTMPQWGGSCWYYLRFMDRENENELVSKEAESYWGGVDSYVGGAEHAVLHLLYARFWHKFLYDIGVVSTKEPFTRLRNQGLILAYAYENENGGLVPSDEVEEKDGKFYHMETNQELKQVVAKMSKSLKNVVNPDDIVKEYGADALRLYEMYMSDFKDSAPWDTKNIIGVVRFLEKSERLFTTEAKVSKEDDKHTMKLLHKTIKKVGEDIENYKFNTAIAELMILVNNGIPQDKDNTYTWREVFCKLLHPFAPHLAEELWERMHKQKTNSIFLEPWPEYAPQMIVDDTIKMAVQVLGKVRGEIEINKDEDSKKVLEIAKNNPDVQKWISGKEIVKEIYVPGRIINIVVK